MRLLWQGLIFVLAIVGLANMIGDLLNVHDGGTFGFGGQSAVMHAGSYAVHSVTPHSAAAAAGVRADDVLTFQPGFYNTVAVLAPVPGDTVQFNDGKRTFKLTAAVDNSPVTWALLAIADLAKVAFIAIALLVAWRRPDDAAARALAFFLVCFGAAINFDFVVVPATAARFASLIFVQSAFLAGALAALAFACRFPANVDSRVRHVLTRSIVPLGITAYVISTVSLAINFTAPNPPAQHVLRPAFVTIYLLIIFATLLALVDSYRRSLREERARMRWVIGTLAVGFSGVVVLFVGIALAPETPWLQSAGLTLLAIPFGLGYVILRHRVIDIGFVINRAVVYTCVSIVVVGAFILIEWILGHVVESNSRTSTIIELFAALALGLSVRFIHARVDRYVDDLFFRDRHLAEAAIRRFAHETAMVTSEDVLIRRTVEVAERNARLNGVAFYGRLHTHYVPLYSTFSRTATELDENDAAILDMRTFHNPVEVKHESDLPGTAAFPMVVRGQLAGFLACGEKTTHEALAPDEHDALRVLARDAGIALDSLRIARIEQELAYLTADGELPANLRMRLASLLDRDGSAQPAGAAARSIQ